MARVVDRSHIGDGESPFDAGVLAVVAEASDDDVDAAVTAARDAFTTGQWPRMPAVERGRLLSRIAEGLQGDREAIARTETLDTGKTLAEARTDVDDVTAVFRYYAGLAGASAGRVVDAGNPLVASRITHEPVGVCALITPWNYPLLQLSWKLAPALAAGNTVVLKPSELTPRVGWVRRRTRCPRSWWCCPGWSSARSRHCRRLPGVRSASSAWR